MPTMSDGSYWEDPNSPANRAKRNAELQAKVDAERAGNRAASQRQVTATQQQQTFPGAAPSAGAATQAGTTAQQFSKNHGGVGYTVNPYGSVSYDNAAQQQRLTQQSAGQIAQQTAAHQAGLASQAAEQAADLQRKQDARRLASLQGLSSSFNSTGGPLPPTVQHGGSNAASEAAFNRAKDRIGQSTRGAVDSLRDMYAGSGSVGAQRQGMEDIAGGGLAQISDVAREQMIQEMLRAGQISDRTYEGGITQRGQDIQAQQQQKQMLMGLYSQLY